MMTQVVDGVQQQLPQRHQAGFAVNGGAPPGVGRNQPERAGRLSPGDGHEVEFFLQVVVLVAQRLRVAEAVGTEQKWSLHRHRAFHAVGEELLRFVGVGALFALVAVVMPVSWMAATHRWLGLGEMPTGPVVEYLARSLSAFYAIMSALCLAVTADLERYRPLVRFLGEAFALLSVALLGVDLAAGMP